MALLFGQLKPLVMDKDAPAAPVFELRFDSAPSSVTIHLDATNTDVALTADASGKIFTATLPTTAFLTGFGDSDVHRKFIGKVTVLGAEKMELLLFGDVLTADVPDVTVHDVAPDVQFSENLVNIRLPTLADMHSSIEGQVKSICKKFYSHFGDEYDFLQIVIARDGFSNRHHFPTRIDAKGIGAQPLDNTAQFGSLGRLLGITIYPNATMFDAGAPTALHEIGHQWLNLLNFAPMMQAGTHWPLSDLAKDLMGISIAAQSNAGTTFNFDLQPMGNDFKLVPNDQPKGYSDLGLYLMGMLPSNQVGQHFVFNDQTQKIKNGMLLGPVTNVSITDIIGHEGARSPDSSHAQKRFRVATILVTKQGLAAHNTMRLYDFFAKRASAKTLLPYTDGFVKGDSKPFRLATNGVGRLDPRIKRHILIDASRDGGVWWSPQAKAFNAGKSHQGKALADHLRALGHTVTELPRPTEITAELLADFDIVVRVAGFGAYTAAEISAYDAWVRDFGSLLLLAEHHPQDALASHFGLQFKSIVRGKQKLSTFTPHTVTKGVGTLSYPGGSGLVAHPATATVLGKLSADSFLDLDDDGTQDPKEPSAPAGLGVMPFGEGRIVFCGDANLWEKVPQPLVKNTLRWFASA